ncbi:hypothetical protein MP638_003310 [Amoeboaphelidium occidentale]|nr:hypothetical protein MP638_003310 [Amoeboaphelidium occidentale]
MNSITKEQLIESWTSLFNTGTTVAQSGKWVVYARKSVDDERDNVALEDQVCRVKQWLHSQGYETFEHVYHDVASGANSDRPGLKEALNQVKTNDQICELAVFKLDRLSRDTILTLTSINDIVDCNKNFVTVEDDGLALCPLFDSQRELNARMKLLFHCIIAEYERHNGRVSLLHYSRHKKDMAPKELLQHLKEFGDDMSHRSQEKITSGSNLKKNLRNFVVARQEMEPQYLHNVIENIMNNHLNS